MSQNLSNLELFHFCEQFSILLHSGISCAEGLQLLLEDSSDARSREILAVLSKDLEESGYFSEALKNSGLFPDTMISYIRVGEETGCLDEVMKSLAEHYEQEIEISRQIKSAVSYPLMMLGMMGAVIVILLVKVLPVFQQVFRQMGLKMNGLSGGLLGAGAVISRYSTAFLIFAAVLVLALLFLCFHPHGQKISRKLICRIPKIREVFVSLDYARFTRGISLGLRSGLTPDASLALARELITQPLVQERFAKASNLLNEGALFAQSMTESGLFEGMEGRLLAIADHAGAADEVMEKLSLRYQENALSLVIRAVSVAEPTIVIVLSLLVGLILLSVMMPLLGILSEMIA